MVLCGIIVCTNFLQNMHDSFYGLQNKYYFVNPSYSYLLYSELLYLGISENNRSIILSEIRDNDNCVRRLFRKLV